jgi:outer membrane receptor protein involved in Fe transport
MKPAAALFARCAVIAMAGYSHLASAQAVGADPTAPVDDQGAGAVPEIIVTAQKREQRLQDVGLTVTAVGAETLANQRIATVGDLARFVPGLNYTPSPNSTPVYTLRGVGFFETSVAAYPDVSIYLDQAPLPLPPMSTLTAFDLERVEVLKGPQGTLFGNNATGGAINFIAAKPTDELDARMSVGYARFNTFEFQGHVSGPLTDTLRARIATKITKGDDWQYSYTRRDSLGGTDQVAGRLILDWTPTDRAQFFLNVNGWRDRSDPQAPQLKRQTRPEDLQRPIGTTGPTGTITPDFPVLLFPAAPRDPRAADWTQSLRPRADNGLWQISLNGSYELTDSIALTSITNYVQFKLHNATEGDGTSLINLDITRDDADAKTFTQELRIASTRTGDPLRWVLGANYERTTVGESIDIQYRDASSGAQQGFSGNTYGSDQEMQNIAGFGNVEYDIADRVTLKGGLRYTDSRRTTVNTNTVTPGYVELPGSPGLLNFINFVWGFVYTPIFCPGVTYQPITESETVAIDPETCVAGEFRGRLKENNVSWSTGLDFKPNDDLLLYLNVSKGYKAGSFPTVSAATYAQFAPVTHESLTAYELGVKSQIGRQISVSAAAFYYDYADKQVRGKIVDPLFGELDRLVNVPKSRIRGIEGEINALPTSGLSLRLAALYLDAKVKRYDGTIGAAVDENGFLVAVTAPFAGVDLPFAPTFQASGSIDYEFPISDNVEAFAGTTVYGQTKSYGSLQLSPQNVADTTITGYVLLDLRAGIAAPDDKWRFMVWGRNITNRFYVTNSLRAYDTIIQYAGRPAEYGVTLSLAFR